MRHVIETDRESATIEAGRALGARLGAGDVVLLEGPLGAGKTALARGIAAGLGCDPGEVSSPTFTVIQEYVGQGVRLHHIDLYRLAPIEVDDLGLEDLMDGSVLVVEWPERWLDTPGWAWRVRLSSAGGDRRVIEVDEPEGDYSTR